MSKRPEWMKKRHTDLQPWEWTTAPSHLGGYVTIFVLHTGEDRCHGYSVLHKTAEPSADVILEGTEWARMMAWRLGYNVDAPYSKEFIEASRRNSLAMMA